MKSVQIYAAVTATGQTYIDVPQAGRIKGVVFTVTVTGVAADDSLAVELSTVSTNQMAVSDARSVAAICAWRVTGGGGTGPSNTIPQAFYCPSDMPVSANDRIYLNYTEVGTGTWGLRALVFY